ncbi:MAG: molecular chaperone TorD family protein [Burkholderiales bacterium]|nr:molecular chaperone TorD family protein [Burkholderiales bacterium]
MDARVERLSELESQAVVLDLLRQLFLAGPTLGLVEGVAALQPDSLRLSPEGHAALETIASLAGENSSRQREWVEALQVEYTRLFIGPLDPRVQPYASFHLSSNRSVVSEETLAVREAYARSGLVVERLNSLPDDHLGVELEFLFALTRAAADADDAAESSRLLAERREFVRLHCATWFEQVADEMAKESSESFYLAIGTLLRSCVRA